MSGLARRRAISKQADVALRDEVDFLLGRAAASVRKLKREGSDVSEPASQKAKHVHLPQ